MLVFRPFQVSLLFLSLVLINCSNKKEEQQSIALLHPGNHATYQIGKEVLVKFDFKKKNVTIDSISCSLDDKIVLLAKSETPGSYVLRTNNYSLGEHMLKIKIWCNNDILGIYQTQIILLSDLSPANFSYQIMRQYPHDTTDFTQGLFYENGVMYEGTGLEGHSKLKKYMLKSGEILKEKKLPDEIFGEGITVLNNKVFQLPYKNKIGFIYDKITLERQGSFNWQMEGWGITQNSSHLIVSTGSQYLFFLDTSNFKIIHRVQVADNKKLVKNINELEYVNGHVWANIWKTDDIIQIDPTTGKVLGRLNLKGILEGYEAEKQKENVLNGIAYNISHKSFYITGKKWPFLFEIKLESGAITSLP